jgi:hypothetical protein
VNADASQQPDGEQPRSTGRLRAADVIDRQAGLLELMATRAQPAAAIKLELEYKRSPGAPGRQTSSHLELAAGFDQDELERIKQAAFALHDEIVARYAGEDL